MVMADDALAQGLAHPGLRERKKQRTRRELETVALRLFQEKGYDATTVEDIADAAFVSPRTFFRYFSSKEEVVFGYQAEWRDRLTAALAAQPPNVPEYRAVSDALVDFAAVLDNEREVLLPQAKLIAANPALLRRSREFARRWEDAVVEELQARAGGSSSVVRHRVIAAVGVAAMIAALRLWHEGNAQEQATDVLRTMLAALDEAVLESSAPEPTAPR